LSVDANQPSVTDVAVRVLTWTKTGTVGAVVSPPVPGIVTETAFEAALRLPAASYALTVYVYELPALTVESVKLVVVLAPISVPPR
jgi:hypothetical protein